MEVGMFKAVAAAVCLCITSLTVMGQSAFTLYLENDITSPHDRYYTHGTRLEQTSIYEVRDDSYLYGFPFWLSKGVSGRVTTGVSQQMYTPSDISIAEPQYGDRPWAGVLVLHWRYEEISQDFVDSVEFQAGVVGEESFAEETQIFVHKHLGVQKPMGWDNQIGTEFGGTVIRRMHWRPIRFPGGLGDILFSADGALGNFFTFADCGSTMRFGFNVPDDFGEIFLGPRGRGVDTSLYAIVGCEARAVGRNISLDGPMFSNGYSVEKEPFVGDVFAGMAARIWTTEVRLLQTFRSKEFKGQDESVNFGSLSVCINF